MKRLFVASVFILLSSFAMADEIGVTVNWFPASIHGDMRDIGAVVSNYSGQTIVLDQWTQLKEGVWTQGAFPFPDTILTFAPGLPNSLFMATYYSLTELPMDEIGKVDYGFDWYGYYLNNPNSELLMAHIFIAPQPLGQVPEPASILLIISGAATLRTLKRRRHIVVR